MTAGERLPPINGSLVLSRFDALIEAGFVHYDDHQKIIEHTDRDLKFHFILTKALAQKPTLSTPPEQILVQGQNKSPLSLMQQRPGSDINTNGYEIDDGSKSHFLIANKFCFSRPHLMMLTCDGYRRQHEPLDRSDLEAAWTTLAALNDLATDYVVFYNCGRDGGCSRLHKHMQLMPLPADGFATAFLDSHVAKEPRVPFEWFHYRFEDGAITPATVASIYAQLLRQATKAWENCTGNTVADGEACPHNVAFTSRWMVVIPRRRAAINKEAGVNSLGMLGIIAVATEREIENWVRLGLTKSLRELGVMRKKNIA
ncbi:hypothetical protein N5P37_004821 [Trichoderma harzianum]|uniref:Uncharacterized protein n=1 Tax=Trichoderma harzianum CBS 226.95 TaxID=983964 RepID=A0A2T3ZS08_TRIHA|nr:hypothetical protein M431DRAFT_550135 [Trichoderma harzianum CBS 226.95]KAK0762021.1 hypothetical protein N5P37_004821 [Trichoderma harzianum]PKK47310.1 hypothetical protein CI102_9082 [Trichoderma harzianum]PTB47590.1 hypothetical protein M431DRAFT_550135 [Trichoderma harzianum CBS 226.95]